MPVQQVARRGADAWCGFQITPDAPIFQTDTPLPESAQIWRKRRLQIQNAQIFQMDLKPCSQQTQTLCTLQARWEHAPAATGTT